MIIFLFLSCGSRKSVIEKQEYENKSDLKEKENVIVTTDSQKVTTTQSNKITGTFIPIDPNIPMTIEDENGKKTTVHNGKWETGKETNTTKTVEDIKQKMEGTKERKALIENSGSSKLKKTDKEEYKGYFPLLIIILICIIIWFFILKDNKNENNKDQTS